MDEPSFKITVPEHHGLVPGAKITFANSLTLWEKILGFILFWKKKKNSVFRVTNITSTTVEILPAIYDVDQETLDALSDAKDLFDRRYEIGAEAHEKELFSERVLVRNSTNGWDLYTGKVKQ